MAGITLYEFYEMPIDIAISMLYAKNVIYLTSHKWNKKAFYGRNIRNIDFRRR